MTIPEAGKLPAAVSYSAQPKSVQAAEATTVETDAETGKVSVKLDPEWGKSRLKAGLSGAFDTSGVLKK